MTAEEPRIHDEEQVEAEGEGESLEERLASAEAEAQAHLDDLRRLAAEFDNYRKRVERERTELWGRAQGELAKRLLEVLDDLQRVSELDVATATAASWSAPPRWGRRPVRSSASSCWRFGGRSPSPTFAISSTPTRRSCAASSRRSNR